MCTEANVVKNGVPVECTTLGQLAEALGISIMDLPRFVDYNPARDDCLCNVRWSDVPNARRATHAEGWPFPEYIIEPPNTQYAAK